MRHTLIVVLLILTVLFWLAAAFIGVPEKRVHNWSFWAAMALAAYFGSLLVKVWT